MADSKIQNSGHSILIFAHRNDAKQAADALARSGIRRDRISLFIHADAARVQADTDQPDAVDEAGAAGAGLGAILEFALFAIPGLGPFVGAGPLAAELTGAIAGTVVGGFSGSLVGLGISEAQALTAERHLRQGNTVLIVRNGGDAKLILEIGKKHGVIEWATN